MPKGKYKGARRCFTNFDDLNSQKEKEEKERAWRKARGEIGSESEEGSEEEESGSSDESENEEGKDEKKPKAKGTEGLIQIENPNHVAAQSKNISSLTIGDEPKPQLSRKERDEMDRQKRAATYKKLHAQGKTDEAKADLERLAIIRKQREEAQKKKDEEKKAKEAAAAVKREKVAKALNKKDKGTS